MKRRLKSWWVHWYNTLNCNTWELGPRVLWNLTLKNEIPRKNPATVREVLKRKKPITNVRQPTKPQRLWDTHYHSHPLILTLRKTSTTIAVVTIGNHISHQQLLEREVLRRTRESLKYLLSAKSVLIKQVAVNQTIWLCSVIIKENQTTQLTLLSLKFQWTTPRRRVIQSNQ